ncbi:MAG: PAS domain S-box protein [Hyphomicrobiaceae bacterium]
MNSARNDAARLKAILDSAVCAIVTIDTRGIIHGANPAVASMFGYAEAELLGRNISILMPADVARMHDDCIARYLATGERHIIGIGREVVGQHKDGSSVPLHLSVGEFEDEGVRYFTGIMVDLRQQRRTEQQLAREEALFQSIFNSVPDAFVVTDMERKIQIANPAFGRIFGYQPAQIVGKPITLLFEDPQEAERHMATAPSLDRQMPLPQAPIIASFRRGNGERFPGEAVWFEVRDGANLGVGYVALVRDVTRELKRETATRTAQRLEAIGQLTGGIAHDFNNLLTVIVGNLELLEPRLSDDGTLELLREVKEAAEKGAQLTDHLLTFARRQRLESQKISLNGLVTAAADLLRRTIGANIVLDVVPAANLWLTRADPGLVETAIVNLVINARDAMPVGGRIVIETRNATLDAAGAELIPGLSVGQYVVLSVTDNGFGMPPEVAERAFEPFFTTKGPGKGSGLGLASVYGFARQSGGHATLYSEVGKGTTVRIYLPRADAGDAVELVARRDEPLPLGRGELVLAVEDDANVRRLTVQRLKALGYEVEAVEDANAALKAIANGLRPAVVFTDYMMPGGISGLELAQRLRAAHPEIAVLLTTGYAGGLIDAGETDALRIKVLMKPYRQAKLAQTIREAIDTNGSRPNEGATSNE